MTLEEYSEVAGDSCHKTAASSAGRLQSAHSSSSVRTHVPKYSHSALTVGFQIYLK